MQRDHDPVPGHLGQHRRRGDAGRRLVALRHRERRHGRTRGPGSRRSATYAGGWSSARDRPAHALDVRHVHPAPVDLGGRDDDDDAVRAPRAGSARSSSSRAAGVSSLESVSPSSRRASPGRSTHAATTSGPAQAPRPASSTPATGPSPCRCSVDCSVQVPDERRTTARAGRHSGGSGEQRVDRAVIATSGCQVPPPAPVRGPSHGPPGTCSRLGRRSNGSGGEQRRAPGAAAPERRRRPGPPRPSAGRPRRSCRTGRTASRSTVPGRSRSRSGPRRGRGPGSRRSCCGVAHHPQLARGHRDRPERSLPGRSRLGQVVDVGLVERLAVDESPGCASRSRRPSARRRRSPA